MKTGDLVQLSAYGSKLNMNYAKRGKVGLVIDQTRPGSAHWKIMWNSQPGIMIIHPRKDLKHIRESK